ncbi:hypothetical protein GW17_00052968 [Ensete ventricosum]|nr:hypothetical protein GW17_00052968 [Ensete ventricosum]
MVLIYVLFPFSGSMVVKGVVCKKNVAHRRMLSKIEKPRFLILGGALEYQRVTNLLSSFDTLLQQVNLPLSLKSGEMVACFKYASINVHSVYLPPPKLEFNFQHQEWVQEEVNKVCSFSNPHELLNGLMTRNKEDLALRAQRSFVSFDAPVSAVAEPINGSGTRNEHDQYKQSTTNQQRLDLEHDKNTKLLSTSTSVSDQFDPPECGLDVHRVLSDGQFPVMADLSDTLDAKWRGENGSALVDGSKLKSVTSVEEAPTDSASENLEENICTDMMPARSGESAKDISILTKTSFSDLYAFINKNCDSSLSEYHPEYISLFKELMQQGWARLLLPLGVNDTVIPVYDDEPTSAISCALVCPDYHFQITDEFEKSRDGRESSMSLLIQESGNSQSFQSVEDIPFESFRSFGSLSRCKKWGAQGGKSNVFFAKSLDDRFIIKQVTKTELESFIKFAPEYFKYLLESISTGSPTCLAKILGIYQVAVKNLKGGKESRMDVLVMENLLFGRSVKWLYDLKGSSRSRYNADINDNNKVLLDQNLIEAMPTSPIFVGNKAKRLLERAVWNDTAFLAVSR